MQVISTQIIPRSGGMIWGSIRSSALIRVSKAELQYGVAWKFEATFLFEKATFWWYCETMENISNENFNIEKSPMKEAYILLGASNPKELNKLYSAEDQRMMKSREWDYDNPNLITNKIKNILESADESSLTEDEKEWREEILWFWYHHAMSVAAAWHGDREQAKKFGAKALELQPENESNKITELYYLLLNDKLDEAEKLAVSIPEGILDDGNPNPEPQTARDLIEDYKSGRLFPPPNHSTEV